MTTALTCINGTIMALLGLLHLYWATGGQWATTNTVPTDQTGNSMLKTGNVSGRLACIVVGLGLMGFSYYYFSKGMNILIQLPLGAESWGIWLLSSIFIARAIGDFKYIGFFKTIRQTGFGKMDTRWYAPLCLYLGLSSIWVGLNS